MGNGGLSVERGLLLGLSGLCLGLLVGALAFRSGPVAIDTELKPSSATPLRVTETRKDASQGKSTASDAAGADERLPEGPIPGLGLMKNATRPATKTRPSTVPEAHEPERPPVRPLTTSLKDAISADRWFRKTRMQIHTQLGPGALVTSNGLTPAGRAVLSRVRELENHGVLAMPYNAASLEDRAQRFSTDDERAALEAHLGRALTRLVLEWRILRTAGPFKLISEAKVTKSRSLQKKLAQLAVMFGQAQTEEEALAIIDPPHPFYTGLVNAYVAYRNLSESGGCKTLPDRRLSRRSKGKHVQALETRLACEGYFAGEPDGIYDEALVEAVKSYQRHHELDVDGAIGSETVRSLNVPMSRRAQQLRLAVHRVRETRVRKMSDYYLVVNIPAYELRAVEEGKTIRRSKVIVGTNRLDDDKVALIQGHLNRTKLFTSRLYQVVINPSWILPERIAKGELKSSLAKDPDYLDKVRIREKTLGNGTKVFVQKGGEGNVLGKVKFLLEKSNAIYLHDTDKKYLFEEKRRDFSHGCMRVHEAVKFAQWLLEKDGWDMKEVNRALGAEYAQRGMDLQNPPSFMTEYLTVDLSVEGKPRFLTDIYKYDKAYYAAELPPKTKARWGSTRLRPRWVPLVPGALVKEWRAAGKVAPRDPNWRPPAEG
ncbi:MAG: L,D-transpeptidase family protein [Myxococcota bacterium]|nr:L,D-transpeptidase family protein [Myxococcota bacterium]